MTMAAEKKSKALALPDNIVNLLADADKRKGFPPGTMLSMMSQEAGGNFEKFISDPGAYHYPLNAEGKRVAKHSGVISTAKGPFGITDSTAKKPGYGVSPLVGTTFEDHLNFAADYLGGRAKAAGSLEGGMAGYGEGAKYASQVVDRRDGQTQSAGLRVPVQVAQSANMNVGSTTEGQSLPPGSSKNIPPEQGVASAEPALFTPNEWVAFTRAMHDSGAPAALDQNQSPTAAPVYAGVQVPDFLQGLRGVPGNVPINFTGFGSYGVHG